LVNLDLGLYKSFRLSGSKSISLRVQAFNLTNYVWYGFPTTDIANANFGRITGTAAAYIPRTIQINVRFVY
ncbi:MAG: hypothetical protein IMZ67_04525, partial [Acidobacteria bacterium]|nr:hypothetical protein [Acidobacteriota bacterium]